jgi:uncharacterized protein GlcG (DUF336 family)
MSRHRLKAVVAVVGLLAFGAAGAGWKTVASSRSSDLSPAEITQILNQAEAAANAELSLLRVDAGGSPMTTRMHVRIVDLTGKVIGERDMDDAWFGSIDIAKAKAFTAMAFSSDRNALTSRSIGELSQPGGALWMIGNSNQDHGIIQFPGGLPLYKNGHLVGGLGVSGDGVNQDEDVARGGAIGFTPAAVIRIDTVTGGGVHYTIP